MVDCGFDLCSVLNLIKKHKFTRIALQFPDEHLPKCVTVYQFLKINADDCVDISITADSTWGSSVDDVSAMHNDADLLVYFGSDLSSSGSIPVVIVPERKPLDMSQCIEKIVNRLVNLQDKVCSPKYMLLYEPSYAHHISDFICALNIETPNTTISVAKLPMCADFENWRPIAGSNIVAAVKLGGLEVDADAMADLSIGLIYLGDKHEQLVNIILKASSRAVVWCSPSSGECTVVHGDKSREFQERYGGMLRVRASRVVGIIVGSMGLTGDATRDLVARLQTLIGAARKKSYCFVMGRLNESKLCNFPEVDIFCLVSNDDHANIRPKTFHVPVVTPFELELGLGAREWASYFCTDVGALAAGEELEASVARVRAANPAAEDESDNEEDGDNQNDQLIGSSTEQQQLSLFDSAAADYFSGREFQGLVAEVPADHEVAIHAGTFGTSVGYVQNL